MANLKDLKIRIGSVKSTQKITKAMQMVAASKLRRAQVAAEQARPYSSRMELLMGVLGANLAGQESGPKLLIGTGSDQTHLIVVATAERGLCGPFNSSISRGAMARIDALRAAGKTVKVLCVGKKGRDALKRRYGELIIDTIDLAGVKRVGFGDAQPIAQRIIGMFEDGEFDVCSIFYNSFQSALVQVVTEQQLIPVSLPETEETDVVEVGDAVCEFEPNEEEILEALLPRNLSVQVYRALLENAASEQGSRMTAMDSATRNAGDMIDKLSLRYNRQRQATITSDLIEIISGAEAL